MSQVAVVLANIGGWLFAAFVLLTIVSGFNKRMAGWFFGGVLGRFYELVVSRDQEAQRQKQRRERVFGAIADLAEATEHLASMTPSTDAFAKARRAVTLIRLEGPSGQGIWSTLVSIDAQLGSAGRDIDQLRGWINGLAETVRVAEGGSDLLPPPPAEETPR